MMATPMSLCVFLPLVLWTSVPVVNASSSEIIDDAPRCPFWHVPVVINGSTTCECRDILDHNVQCSFNYSVNAATCFCMSYLEDDGATEVAGNCLYTCIITRDMTHSNTTQCPSQLHRTGQMCGRCEEDYALPVYSYFLGCVPCSNSTSFNWLKYLAVAYLPLTGFFVVIIVFRISATSASMNALVLIGQLRAFSTVLKIEDRRHYTDVFHGGTQIVPLLGFFNLDFFRGLYQPFCLSPHWSIVQVTALDYLIGFYPLLLILVTYVLVKLHDNFSLVVRLWKPFNRCFARLDNQWNFKGSLVGAFATFLLLSYVKVLNVSCDLLTPVTLYDVNGDNINKTFLYFNGSMEYFGEEHKPYGILAIIVLLVFNILPVLLLLLYPCHCFQRCLVRSRLNCQALHIFMDSFQGCYREEPRYCRCFAAVYLLARIGAIACFSLTLIYRAYKEIRLFYIIIPAMLLAAFRPYKDAKYNSIDVVLLLSSIGVHTHIANANLRSTNLHKFYIYQALHIFSLSTCFVYVLILVVHKLFPECAKQKLKDFIHKMKIRIHGESVAEPWPERLNETRGESTPLIPP